MEYLKNNREAILDYLEGLSNSELVTRHNQMCQNANNMDDEIYSNEEDFFNTYFDGVSAHNVLQKAYYGIYDFTHYYVIFNGYGNLESFDEPRDKISLYDIVDDILENPHNYDIEFEDDEDELEKVIIDELEDGTFGIYDENGMCVEGDFNTFEDAEEYINTVNLLLVTSFNL